MHPGGAQDEPLGVERTAIFTLYLSFVNFYFLSVSIISIIMSMSIYKVHNVYVVLHDYNL